jgi:hypothetical protein
VGGRSSSYGNLTNQIAAAEAILERLAAGRSFTVEVGAPRVEITLTDVP